MKMDPAGMELAWLALGWGSSGDDGSGEHPRHLRQHVNVLRCSRNENVEPLREVLVEQVCVAGRAIAPDGASAVRTDTTRCTPSRRCRAWPPGR